MSNFTQTLFKRTSLTVLSLSSVLLMAASLNVNAEGQADRQNEIENFDKASSYIHLHDVKTSKIPVLAANEHLNTRWGSFSQHAHKMGADAHSKMMDEMMAEHHKMEGNNADHRHMIHPHTISGGMGAHMQAAEYKDQAFGSND